MNAAHAHRRWCILGTAGHIDHGKSALVKALTGTDPDRLPEEQQRGMTIELGFARLQLSAADGADLEVSIVDVPGHERFVRTMVAGATGIDIGMLVVAADDGVMPQTLEHIDILNFLGVRHGLIVISKQDLVGEERLAIARQQLGEVVENTGLAKWQTLACSARTGQGLDALRDAIAHLVRSLPLRDTGDVFRIAIDRVFAVKGRGTVVTGSVLAGSAAPGASMELHPGPVACKVREVQSHGAAADVAMVGRRAALNLTGVDREAIDRGMELASPGYLTATRYLDAQVMPVLRARMPGAAGSLVWDGIKSHRRVRLCMGTRETMCVLVVIGAAEIAPGQLAFAQLRCSEPVVAEYGQRFIIRDETATHTLGGGQVVRPVSRRLRPMDPQELTAINRAMSDTVDTRVDACLQSAGFESVSPLALAARAGAATDAIAGILDQLRKSGRLIELVAGRTVHIAAVSALADRALAYLRRQHATNPLEPGLLRDRYIGWLDKRSAAGIGRVMCARLESSGDIVVRGPYVAHREFRPALSPEDAALVERLVAEISAAKFDPPAWIALKTVALLSKQRAKVMEDIARTEPRLVSFAPGQYISQEALSAFKKTVHELGRQGPFKLADVRDRLKLSRRAVQPLLEYLDKIQFTRRVGDERILIEKSA
ncbi:MAG: hypothetical protein AMXMBFR20_19000 [Planctomycetia bacterium]